MSESEKRLRGIVAFLHTEEYPETAARMDDALNALLAEHRAEVSSARNAALEEARETFPDDGVFSGRTVRGVLKEIQSAPVAVLDAKTVREVLATAHKSSPFARPVLEAVATMLGLPLDAEGAGGRRPGCLMCSVTTQHECHTDTSSETTAGEVETCRLCPRPKHPGSSCYGGNEDGHRRDGDECMADCPGCANPSEVD